MHKKMQAVAADLCRQSATSGAPISHVHHMILEQHRVQSYWMWQCCAACLAIIESMCQGQGEHVESEAEVRVTAEDGEKAVTSKTAAYCCRAVQLVLAGLVLVCATVYGLHILFPYRRLQPSNLVLCRCSCNENCFLADRVLNSHLPAGVLILPTSTHACLAMQELSQEHCKEETSDYKGDQG